MKPVDQARQLEWYRGNQISAPAVTKSASWRTYAAKYGTVFSRRTSSVYAACAALSGTSSEQFVNARGISAQDRPRFSQYDTLVCDRRTFSHTSVLALSKKSSA